MISRQLHPDKAGDVSEEKKLEKQEVIKIFKASNEELMKYIIKHQVFVEDEENEDEEEEDGLSEKEIERILKKGCKVRYPDHWSGKFRVASRNYKSQYLNHGIVE